MLLEFGKRMTAIIPQQLLYYTKSKPGVQFSDSVSHASAAIESVEEIAGHYLRSTIFGTDARDVSKVNVIEFVSDAA